MSNNFKIPKDIYQTYESWENTPDVFKNKISNTLSININYNYHFYNNNDCDKYILETYGEAIFDIYDSISLDYAPAKADIFRYLIIYDKGGIYYDIKSFPLKPLDDIILPTDELLLSSWFFKFWDQHLKTGVGEYQNWFIIAKPRHPYIKNVIKLVIKKILTSKINQYKTKKGVINLTGPITYTQGIIPLMDSKEYTFKPNNYNKMFSFNGCNIPELGEGPDKFDWRMHYEILNKSNRTHYYFSDKDIINHEKIMHLKNNTAYDLIVEQLDNI